MFADQLLRAAQSQPRNIAEGAGRRTTLDQARFYAIARGSAMEAAAALDTMLVMKLIADPKHECGIESTVNLNINANLDLIIDQQPENRPVDSCEMLSFQKLRVYQRSIEFLAFTMDVIGSLPRGHADLADQLLRAAQSQPRNIAEGAGRRTTVDQARFYAIARGSAMEAAAALDTMLVMKLIADPKHECGIEHLEAIVAMLTKLAGQ